MKIRGMFHRRFLKREMEFAAENKMNRYVRLFGKCMEILAMLFIAGLGIDLLVKSLPDIFTWTGIVAMVIGWSWIATGAYLSYVIMEQ